MHDWFLGFCVEIVMWLSYSLCVCGGGGDMRACILGVCVCCCAFVYAFKPHEGNKLAHFNGSQCSNTCETYTVDSPRLGGVPGFMLCTKPMGTSLKKLFCMCVLLGERLWVQGRFVFFTVFLVFLCFACEGVQLVCSARRPMK